MPLDTRFSGISFSVGGDVRFSYCNQKTNQCPRFLLSFSKRFLCLSVYIISKRVSLSQRVNNFRKLSCLYIDYIHLYRLYTSTQTIQIQPYSIQTIYIYIFRIFLLLFLLYILVSNRFNLLAYLLKCGTAIKLRLNRNSIWTCGYINVSISRQIYI